MHGGDGFMTHRKRKILILCLIALLVCGVAWRRAKARLAPAAHTSISAGTRPDSLDFDGRIRTYLLHVPPGYDANTPLPLVFVLHGATQSPGSAEKMSDMSSKADQEHFLAVYPSGTGNVVTWNAGNCCGYAIQNHVDDVGFLRALLEKLEHDYAVDRKRIYFTGISNGAMMSYRVACEMSDQVAAIAPVEGALNVDCHPSAPVSVLIFHGTADRLVPYNGGSTPFQIGDKRSDNSVDYAVNFWTKRDACSAAPNHEETTEVHTEKYSGCQDGTGVALYAIPGGRHMWPGLAISGNSVPATDLIWSFFAAHPKP
jgi:polyhydroxybutyrate depolymerase